MSAYHTAPTTAADLTVMLQNMSQEDRDEAVCYGVPIRRVLWQSYRNSFWRKSHFYEGELAAISAVSGVLLGGVGHPWVCTTPVIERARLTYFREARREIEAMQRIFPRLESMITAKNVKALKFFEIMGFTIHPQVENSLFCVISRQRASVGRSRAV
jgi:hypothetical protein